MLLIVEVYAVEQIRLFTKINVHKESLVCCWLLLDAAVQAASS